MNTEQLKMILDALQSLGAEGKDAFVWWLVLDKLIPPIAWLITFAGIVFVATRIVRACTNHSRMQELRKLLGIYTHEGNGDLKAISTAIAVLSKLPHDERTKHEVGK